MSVFSSGIMSCMSLFSYISPDRPSYLTSFEGKASWKWSFCSFAGRPNRHQLRSREAFQRVMACRPEPQGVSFLAQYAHITSLCQGKRTGVVRVTPPFLLVVEARARSALGVRRLDAALLAASKG